MGVYQETIRNFFDNKISLSCRKETQIYITNIFSDITPQDDFSTESLTLVYNQAVQKYEFETFRKLADWLFFTKTLFPQSLNGASPQYYSSLARTSYDRCHRILQRQWLLYEELADQFDTLIKQCQHSLISDDELLWRSL
jgi:hypothetical protein